MLVSRNKGVHHGLQTSEATILFSHLENLRGAKEERELLARLLYQYRETERRRLYSKYKCSSLFDYLVKYLKYSNDQADRRIKAMRLFAEVPEIEEKLIRAL